MISGTVEYALRALVEFGRSPAGETLLGRELAERTGIAKDYLAKILGTLRSAGMLSASPGIGGGYRLARAPEAIVLIELVRLFDGEQSLPKCLLHHERPCSDDDPCSAHALWGEVRAHYVSFLETTTIAAISQVAGEKHPAAGAARGARPDKEETRKDPR
ncbi:MAG: Rrf2 family transcriptional regulator [bacterium]|nr:Rrf2 family transcriptional regulator [bacterium]